MKKKILNAEPFSLNSLEKELQYLVQKNAIRGIGR